MKMSVQDHQFIGFPINTATYKAMSRSQLYLPDPNSQYQISCSANGPAAIRQSVNSFIKRMNKLGKKADSFANGIWEHVKLGMKIGGTVKGKLSLGAKIIQLGGVEKIFKKLFATKENEKLLKASQCYLSTTAGPIAGLLFISNEKIAFCSERSIKLTSPNGKLLRFYYKVLIPLWRIERVSQSENTKKPSQKYMEIVTEDNFDFWFMGFVNYQKAFKYIQQAMSQITDHVTN